MSYAHTISDINTMTMNVVLYEKKSMTKMLTLLEDNNFLLDVRFTFIAKLRLSRPYQLMMLL